MNEILSEIHLKQLEDHYATGKPYWMPFGTREDGMSDSGAEWIKEALTLREENRALHAQLAHVKAGHCLKCNMGPLRESCAYPEACEHPGRELAYKLNQALLNLTAAQQRVKELEGGDDCHLKCVEALDGTPDRDGIRLLPSWERIERLKAKVTALEKALKAILPALGMLNDVAYSRFHEAEEQAQHALGPIPSKPDSRQAHEHRQE